MTPFKVGNVLVYRIASSTKNFTSLIFTDQLVPKHVRLKGNNKHPLKKKLRTIHKNYVKKINKFIKFKILKFFALIKIKNNKSNIGDIVGLVVTHKKTEIINRLIMF